MKLASLVGQQKMRGAAGVTFALASCLSLSAFAQSADGAAQSTNSTQAVATSPVKTSSQPLSVQSNEGFWGHLNPFARKSWVNRQVNPVKDRMNELDELSSQNAKDIKDVDARAQDGIHHAQDTADQANQQAQNANGVASQAQELAKRSGSQTEKLNSTVANLDQYQAVSATEIRFRAGQAALNVKAKDALDAIAAQMQGQKGYLVEVQGYSSVRGQAGLQSSERLADSVVRYLVEQHQVPVYRIHKLGMGNTGLEKSNGVAVGNSVHVTLIQNSLAALNSSGNPGGSPIGATQATPSGSVSAGPASSPSAQQ